MRPGHVRPGIPGRRKQRIVRKVELVSYWGGLSTREINRRLHGLGLSRRSEPALIAKGLFEVARFLAAASASQCCLTGYRTDEPLRYGRGRARVQAVHLRSRGSFGADFYNVVPLLKSLHRELHTRGDADFAQHHQADLQFIATRFTEAYLDRHPETRAFLDSLRSSP